VKINFVCIEDGLIAIGFRKMASLIKSIHPNTNTYYLPLSRRTLISKLTSKQDDPEAVVHINRIAHDLAKADILAFSSMSDYAFFVKSLSEKVKQINPNIYVVWGGVHPIIVPEDAIQSADAICTGEGEFAFQEFLEKFKNGQDYTQTKNFWFKEKDKVIKKFFFYH